MAMTEAPVDLRLTEGVRTPTVFADFARRTFGALSLEEARKALQVRPAPVAGIRRVGPDPHRILMFGGGALLGAGLSNHNLGLPGRVADQLAQVTGRGVHLDVVAHADPTAAASIAGLGGLRLRRYDAVIIVLGEAPAPGHLAPSLWRGALVGLVRVLLHEASPVAGLFVWDSAQAMAAIAGRRPTSMASRTTSIGEEVCAMTARVRFGELPPPFRSERSLRFSDATQQGWAELIATKLRPGLAELARRAGPETPRAFRNRPHDERLRQRALGCLGLVAGKQDDRLDSEIRQARRMFGVETASLTIIDGEWNWMKASTGPLVSLPRAETICDWAIRSDGLTLVNDVQKDPRTHDVPLLKAIGIRFYAGYPIHTWDGYRIGMLCIHDTAPQNFLPGALEGLRDIAGRIEQLIWSEALRRHRL